MIFFGTDGKHEEFGPRSRQECSVCRGIRDFRLTLTYRNFHVMFVFGAVTEKQFFFSCAVCNRGVLVDPAEAEARIGRNPIPLYRRYGLFVFLVPVAGLVVAEFAYEAGLVPFSALDALDQWNRSRRPGG